MKRLLVTLTIALSFFSLSSFANDADVTPAALASFNKSFKNATEVSWSISNDYYKANFALNGQYISAYYNTEGKMIAMARNISSFQLPIALQTSLKADHEDLWITDLFELANDEGTSYYVTLENADTKIVLKSSGTHWENFKKQRKS